MSPAEEWWVDYLEGELDPDTRTLYSDLLKRSSVDREIFLSCAGTRDLVENYGDVAGEITDVEIEGAKQRTLKAFQDLLRDSVTKPNRPRVRG